MVFKVGMKRKLRPSYFLYCDVYPADLKCQYAVSGGGFLITGFTADTQAWINVLFIRDDDHDQWHKTCLNSAREREKERESAWMTEHVLHQVKSYSWNKLVCDVLRVMLL